MCVVVSDAIFCDGLSALFYFQMAAKDRAAVVLASVAYFFFFFQTFTFVPIFTQHPEDARTLLPASCSSTRTCSTQIDMLFMFAFVYLATLVVEEQRAIRRELYCLS
jgi:hypothetical protein